tara:strand:+ start:268 stop:1230 length:963 start_codon:yes stop_codon:yes gene_type:complete
MSELRINNITNKSGTGGPVIAGISTVNSTGAMTVPIGNSLTKMGVGIATEAVIRDKLTLWWDAHYDYPGKDGDDYVMTDMSGNGNAGWIHNSPTYNSANKGYIGFSTTADANSSQVIVGPPSNIIHTAGNPELTMQQAVRTTNATQRHYFASIKRSDPESTLVSFRINTKPDTTSQYLEAGWWGCLINMQDTDWRYHYINSPAINNGNWHIITVTCGYNRDTNNGYSKLYVDGSMVSHSDDLTTANSYARPEAIGQPLYDTNGNGTGPFTVGAYSPTTSSVTHEYDLTGDVGYTMVWDKELSDAEVQSNYDAFKGRYGLS